MPTIDGLEISLNDHIQKDEVLDLYRANGWSAAEKPDKLLPPTHTGPTHAGF